MDEASTQTVEGFSTPSSGSGSNMADERNSKVGGMYLSKRASVDSQRLELDSGRLFNHFRTTSLQEIVSWERAMLAVLAAREGVRTLESGS